MEWIILTNLKSTFSFFFFLFFTTELLYDQPIDEQKS
jgi:hypothetical protein